MFTSLRLHGGEAEILWGYRPAVLLRSWSIVRQGRHWILHGTVQRVDAFQARQRPLIFTARRDRQSGRWAFPVLALDLGTRAVQATLGPPEH